MRSFWLEFDPGVPKEPGLYCRYRQLREFWLVSVAGEFVAGEWLRRRSPAAEEFSLRWSAIGGPLGARVDVKDLMISDLAKFGQ